MTAPSLVAAMLLLLRAAPAPGAESESRRPSPSPAATPRGSSESTFCSEWVRQSRQGYERLTLFRDRSLVWKRSRDGKDEISRKKIAPEELSYYCDYFARPEVWSVAADQRSGLTGEFAVQSVVTVVRADGARRTIRFDDFSPLSPEAASLKAALEGLKGVLTDPLAPASRFAPETLSTGQLLKRFDGAVFRIRALDREKGVVELEGVNEPYRQFRKIEELRFQFSPPE
ncbi:MAG: hypothetical protein LC796_14205 [Acidobacteria bacterium]|nr:hypothetical protein [Acidobacteriota bacterium]MCA1610641.1 hypothetical protein [Acidobacteriota bacterium]